ncbi:NAD(P)-dependent oxidoreductase [Alteribacillus sp. HJP-4]|uniref:NAD(P)-dependent oxidoreductase n=1 Tax=Alteribacillus sp. HJP-4 TaxID=2775394 RepID=UPI0035CCF7E1
MIIATHEDLLEYKAELETRTGEHIICKKIKDLTKEEKHRAEVIISYGNYDDELYEKELAELPALKYVHIMSAGIETVPLAYLKGREVVLTNSHGVHAKPISEYVIGMLLYHFKKIAVLTKAQSEQSWLSEVTASELEGKTIGILGTGSIGKEIAKKASIFQMTTLGMNSNGQAIEGFDQTYALKDRGELFRQSDIVCSVLPSTPKTIGIFNDTAFQQMKRGTVFMNVGRGDAVVESALAEALDQSIIELAILDVFDSEPLPRENPLWKHKKVIVTPHFSSKTDQYINRTLALFYKNYMAFRNDQHQNLTNVI